MKTQMHCALTVTLAFIQCGFFSAELEIWQFHPVNEAYCSALRAEKIVSVSWS